MNEAQMDLLGKAAIFIATAAVAFGFLFWLPVLLLAGGIVLAGRAAKSLLPH